MIRRAFTLLETILAAIIGAVIIASAMSIFFAMERSDRLLAARAEQTGDLQRTRLVMQRVAMNLLMSSVPPPRRETPRATEAAADPKAGDKSKPPPEENPPIPRLYLDADPELAGAEMSKSDEAGMVWAVQRLEVVVTDSPVPTTSRDAMAMAGFGVPRRRAIDAPRGEEGRPSREDEATGRAAVQAALFEEQAQGMVRAVRGAFEFREQASRGSQGKLEDVRGVPGAQRVRLWELWWVPLPPRGDFAEDQTAARRLGTLGEPYLVASNIRYARWTMFDDREKKVRLAASRRSELPAYVELEMETGAGIRVHWMFETDCAVGPEVPPSMLAMADDAANPEESGLEAGGPGGDGRAAGAGPGTNPNVPRTGAPASPTRPAGRAGGRPAVSRTKDHQPPRNSP